MSASSRNSSSSLTQALDSAAEAIIAAVLLSETPAPVVLIDGRSGAGKSTLARRVAQRWPRERAPQLIALDSIYPGWDGLAEGTRRAEEGILRPHSRGVDGRWARWDWEHDRDAESHAVYAVDGVIVEGCGVLTRSAAECADVTVWLDAPAERRKARALERDGDSYRAEWERWARQEEAHIARHLPQELAQLRFVVP